MKYRTFRERLFANSVAVHRGHTIAGAPSECWEWIGNTDHHDYGRVTQRIDGKHKKVRAHRASYEEFIGPLKADDTLDHRCRNTRCIHPNHSEPVSNEVNAARMQAFRKYGISHHA